MFGFGPDKYNVLSSTIWLIFFSNALICSSGVGDGGFSFELDMYPNY